MDMVTDNQMNSVPGDGMAWWMKYTIKGASVILATIAFILGVVTCISISFSCIIAGIILVLVYFNFKNFLNKMNF
jgi:hypothetical protein